MLTPSPSTNRLLLRGKFGLEKENLRITQDGKLALTIHPTIFGSKTKNPYITTDFSESQVEMITPPLASIKEMHDFMHTLHDIVNEEIGDELLWPQSLPPLLPAEHLIPVSKYDEDDNELEAYRHIIAKTYGKYRQLICGIHFNISLTPELFQTLHLQDPHELNLDTIQEHTYLKILRQLLRHRWLLTWLFGETPVAEKGLKLKPLQESMQEKVKCTAGLSIRTGPCGYRNKEEYILDFSSIENFNLSVEQLITQGKINAAKELYLPVRLKHFDPTTKAPSHLELRMIDLDPMSPSGVNLQALYGAHILFLYGLIKEEAQEFDPQSQRIATQKQDLAACYGRSQTSYFPPEIALAESIAQEALLLIEDLERTLAPYEIWEEETYAQALAHMRQLALDPNIRLGVTLFEETKDDRYLPYYLRLAKENKAQSIANGFRFWGLSDMEMSTQLLLRAAICKGVSFEILDRKENFVKLSQAGHVQLVMQATKTAIDNYATVLAMENKVVTKKVLDAHHIRVPQGGEYDDRASALADFARYQHRPIVIKPKSTNFGVGISILKEAWSIEDFHTALDIAFEHDHTLLIEEFISGKEYRFFVIDDEVVGILHRVPANVTGDGIHSINQLIEQKNTDPRRGKGYKTPLEKIKQGKEEELFLKLQGFTFSSIPEENQIVFLRENSNISTGGDSLDFTDEMHPSYKAIALHAARAIGARITGVDMMINDLRQMAQPNNHAIIEMNFNPALHIHCFPYQGKHRRVNFKVLHALGY